MVRTRSAVALSALALSSLSGPVIATTPEGRVVLRDPSVEDLHTYEVECGLRYGWN